MEHWAIALIAAATVAALFAINLFFIKPLRFIRHFRAQNVRGHAFRPFVGQLPELIKDAKREVAPFFTFAADSRERFGPVYYQFVCHMPRLVILDPDLIADIYGKKARHYKKPEFMTSFLDPLLGKGLVTSEGALWKQQRHVINPAFTGANIDKMLPLMVAATQTFLDGWQATCEAAPADAKGNHTVQVQLHECMSAVTLDIIAAAAFGSAALSSVETRALFYQNLTSTFDTLTDRFRTAVGLLPIIKDLPLPSKRKIQRSTAAILRVVDAAIADRKAGKTRPALGESDLLDMMLSVRYEDGSSMPDKQVRDEAMTFVLAGHETTSNLLAWLFYELGQHPEVWDECKREVDDVLQKRAPDSDSLEQLTLIESVLFETLRLWPPAPITTRGATEAHTIGVECGRPIHIPRDTVVIVPAFRLHRDPALWEEPDKFNPHRFLRKTEHGKRRHLYQFMAFGGGMRMCIGQSFAIKEAKIIFAMILQRFTVAPVPAQCIAPSVAVTMRPRHGLLVDVTPVRAIGTRTGIGNMVGGWRG